jgi:ribosomal protein S18 acetylase RimI-like enzyme
MRLRPPSDRDLDTLLGMMEDFNRFEGIVWTRAAGEAPLRKLMGDATLGFVTLACRDDDDTPIGYAVVTYGFDLEWGGRDAFLTELYLAPAARGQRLGTATMAAIETKARAHGAQALHLMVRHANTHAQALYRAAGYTVPDRLFMTKKL